MNRKKIIAILIMVLIALVVLVGCELFEGSPNRDNINDPDNELGVEVKLNFYTTLDSINVVWEYNNSGAYNHQIFYGIGSDINKAAYTDIISGKTEYLIEDENLEYGVDYNIWMKSIEQETDEKFFILHGTAATESSGTPDTGFSGDGLYVFSDTDSDAYAIAGDYDSNIFVGGSSYDSPGPPPMYSNVIYKMNTSGSLVTDFGSGGRYATMAYPTSAPDMKFIYNGGLTVFSQKSNNNVAFLPLDFSGSDYNTTATYITQYDAILTPDGSVVVCGQNATNYNLSVKRLSADFSGEVNSFGMDNATYFGGADSSCATSIAVSEDGDLFIAGYSELTAVQTPFLGRFNLSTLALEDIFNVSSATWVNHGNNILTAVGTDGQVLLAGYDRLAAFNPGTLNEETVFKSIDSMFIASDLLVQHNGKILLAGTINALSGCIYRFNQDGTLDTSFNGDGSFVRDDYFFEDIEIIGDGHIVIAGKDHVNMKGAVFLLK